MSYPNQQFKRCVAVSFMILLSLFSTTVYGQDVESFFQDIIDRFKDPLKISGGVNATTTYNKISGIDPRTTPFNWTFGANINFDIIGISAPLSANFSSGSSQFSLPSVPKLPSYAFVGVSPSYKWVTLHAGDRSMTFSPYTLSGHNFRGGGMELTPGKFKFAAMYGRLKRAVAEDFNSLQDLDPAYKRMGWGFKTGYGDDKNSIEMIFFRGYDDENSIPPVTASPDVRPSDNAVFSINGKKNIGDKFDVTMEYAVSALTRDKRTSLLPNDEKNIFKSFFGIIKQRTSTGYFNAVKVSSGYNHKKFNIRANYERVDPGYQTLGALFFNNDIENFTGSVSTKLFKGVVNISSNIGVQRNNLAKTETNTSFSLIGSVNMAITANEKTNIAVAYSNFKNTNKIKTQIDPLTLVDSIFLAQINQNASLVISHNTGEEYKSTLITSFNFQNATSIKNDEIQEDQVSSIFNGNITYSLNITPIKMSVTTGFNVNYSVLSIVNTLSLAPTLSVSKPFLDGKMNASLNVAYSNVFTDGASLTKVLNTQANLSYTLFDDHKLGLNMTITKRPSKLVNTGIPTFREFTLGFNYNYNLASISVFKKKEKEKSTEDK